MTTKKKISEKNILLFVGALPVISIDAIKRFEKKNKRKFRIALIRDSRRNKNDISDVEEEIDINLTCDLNSPVAIAKTLAPYKHEIFAATARGDSTIPALQKVIPHIPYVRTPTVESLTWATNKIQMREMLTLHDKNLSPLFMVVTDAKKATVKTINEKIGFPVIVKPSGLAASLLVTTCFHQEELQKVLRTVFRKIKSVHKENNGRGEPEVLVEQFIEGEMYSIDAYVNSRGVCYFCPPVAVKTGHNIGFDDFFGYRRLTPTQLTKDEIAAAEKSSTKALHALRLRSTSAHIELLRTEQGEWKIIEVGPRVGGFRAEMYQLSFGINHVMNDLLIHTPEKPAIPRKVKGYTAVMQFYAKKEGKLTKLTGIKKAETLKSFKDITVNKKIGERCNFARNGGKSVFNITLFNKNRSDLLADIRRLETTINIETI